VTKLRELQRQFISDCLSADLTDDNVSIETDVDTQTISAKGQMGIYRESAIGNIIIPMQITYPVIEKLVGREFFRATCRQYIKTYWPKTGNMDDYGQEFAEFLSNFEPVKELPYISDVARLEWLYHESSIADDMEPSDWTSFASLSEDDIEKTEILLHPTVRLFYSLYPVKEIWDINQHEPQANSELDLDTLEGGYILCYRQGIKTVTLTIAEADYTFLFAILNGKTLYQSAELALDIDQGLDIQGIMATYLKNGVLCQFFTQPIPNA